ncbi:hypothetical protein ACLOJK_034787, partial [Asimina triloba]
GDLSMEKLEKRVSIADSSSWAREVGLELGRKRALMIILRVSIGALGGFLHGGGPQAPGPHPPRHEPHNPQATIQTRYTKSYQNFGSTSLVNRGAT